MKSTNRLTVPHLTDGTLAGFSGIRHVFFTRAGGVSGGIYASLNCGLGSGDERALVLENRARAAATLGIEVARLATPYQIHSAEAVVVEEPWPPGQGPRADAVVTRRPSVGLGVGTADCAPVLFAEPQARVIGAAHAGWRGALAGVLEATITAMEQQGADRRCIFAAVGPTISQANYEVGPEVAAQFTAEDAGNARYFRPSARAGHSQFDLSGYIVSRLKAADVVATSLDSCTYADSARFFSYRRAVHRGEPDYGRLMSAIVLNA